jgi:lycopene beta-cyclase
VPPRGGVALPDLHLPDWPGPLSLAILGGGLSGGLIAFALAQRRPEIRFELIERGDTYGGNHVWSFFDSDIADQDRWLVEPFISHRWDSYEVRFPAHRRVLPSAYNAIESDRFDRVLKERLAADSVRLNCVAEPQGAVIDTRGPGNLKTLDVGWQKFVGVLLNTAEPHGLIRPIVMDATVEQIDGYRFVYVLPFGPSQLFVEDTYYSDTPDLDIGAVRARVLDYAAAKGWRVTPGNRIESGVLPVVVGGAFDSYWGSTGESGAKAGMRAGLFHPTTGYSLPDAVRLASAIARAPDLSAASLAQLTRQYAAKAWKERGFYRMLDTMLFRAAMPHERYRIMERFYRLPETLIGRFYAARSTRFDQLRILTGKPPIPIARALRAILRNAS